MAPWYNMANFYHIYPLGLCGCPHENDYRDLVADRSTNRPRPFETLTLWADHAGRLGFDAIYIGPLFESRTHGYDTTDFKKVDSRLGTNEEFIEWVNHCHEQGISVVVDGVFNHTGRDFFAFQDLLAHRWDSWAKDWYCGVNFDGDNGFHDGFSYESWRGIDILPRLNLWNPEVRNYLLDVAEFWMDEFGVDGIRLDSADVLNFDFMRELRDRTKAKRWDFWLMGEVIHGDYGRWVNDGMLDSVTNYELHKAIYSAHNDQNYFEMAHNVLRLFGPYGLCKNAHLYTFCDNQDVNRIASSLNNPKNLTPVTVFLFTILGIPSVYYGSEFGIEGKKEGNGARSDDPLRPALDLIQLEANGPHPEIVELIRCLIAARKVHTELSLGSYHELLLQNKYYAFGRRLTADNPDNPTGQTQACVVVLNNDPEPVELTVPLAALECGFSSAENLLTEEAVTLENASLNLRIEGNSGQVIKLYA